MPVFKYESFESAERALWQFNPTGHYYAQLFDFFELMGRLRPPAVVRGVRMYRSLGEANAERLRRDVEGTVLTGRTILQQG
jgi:hypothetical protein